MIDDVVTSFRQNLEGLVARLDEPLSPASFQNFLMGLRYVVSRAGIDSIEAFLPALEQRDIPQRIIEENGQRYRFKEIVHKSWLTVFGKATIPRRYYQQDSGGQGIHPLDECVGMVGKFMTPDVEEMAAYATALLTPSEVEQLLGKVLPEGPSRHAVQRTADDVADHLEEHFDDVHGEVATHAPLEESGDTLVLGWDGVTVRTREPGKMKGRHAHRPGVRDNNDTKSSFKEAGVATLSVYRRARRAEDRPERLDIRYLAQMPEPEMETLMRRVESVGTQLTTGRSFPNVLVICDGKSSIWKAASRMSLLHNACFVLDFYHAAEHLSKVAEALFGKQAGAAKRWFDRYRKRLRDCPNAVTGLLRSMRYYRKLNQLRQGSERWHVVRRALAYFSYHASRMNYAELRARGLPIGSGPTESACKNIVGARLKRSGMRWSNPGGQRILHLRTQVKSGTWHIAWQSYLTEGRASQSRLAA